VVGLGGDTDTNAAVAGALLGALHGVDAIPSDWVGTLVAGGTILHDAADLAALV
jgi:ADP-ribosylglycohydrolase